MSEAESRERLIAENESLRTRLVAAEADLQCTIELAAKRQNERDDAIAALNVQHFLNVDSPLFEGLVGGMFAPGCLLATLAKVKRDRNEAREVAQEMYEDTFQYVPAGEFWLKKYPWLVTDKVKRMKVLGWEECE